MEGWEVVSDSGASTELETSRPAGAIRSLSISSLHSDEGSDIEHQNEGHACKMVELQPEAECGGEKVAHNPPTADPTPSAEPRAARRWLQIIHVDTQRCLWVAVALLSIGFVCAGALSLRTRRK